MWGEKMIIPVDIGDKPSYILYSTPFYDGNGQMYSFKVLPQNDQTVQIQISHPIIAESSSLGEMIQMFSHHGFKMKGDVLAHKVPLEHAFETINAMVQLLINLEFILRLSKMSDIPESETTNV